MRRFVPILALCLAYGLSVVDRTASAQVDPNQPPVVRLTLSPAAEPTPALKYELLPRPNERKPGNAATNYYRAVIALQLIPDEVAKDESKWFAEFGDDPYQKVPRERLVKWIDAHQRAFDELRHGVYRESCDWGLRMQDLRGMEAITYLIEEFQHLRWAIRALNLRTRLAIEQGKLDEAFDMLRMHYQMAHDVTGQPNLICGLIGVAFVHLADERMEQWIGMPGTPNLYWAIASLPRPFISMRNALDQERALPERLFPYLADADTAVRSKEEWQRLLVDTMQQLGDLGEGDGKPRMTRLQAEATVLAVVSRGYPIAKRELLAAGYDRQRLEAMPVGQVVAIHMARDVRDAYDALAKTYYLPYHQAIAWTNQVQLQQLEKRRADGPLGASEVFPIANVLLPAVSHVLRAEIRSERRLSALQVLEAIRMHQAAHGGRLPASLDEITVVPVPLNPATLKPFPYRLEGDGAVLEVPTVLGEPAQNGRKYVLKAR